MYSSCATIIHRFCLCGVQSTILFCLCFKCFHVFDEWRKWVFLYVVHLVFVPGATVFCLFVFKQYQHIDGVPHKSMYLRSQVRWRVILSLLLIPFQLHILLNPTTTFSDTFPSYLRHDLLERSCDYSWRHPILSKYFHFRDKQVIYVSCHSFTN